MEPFDIRRYGIGEQSYARLRLQTALGAATGSVGSEQPEPPWSISDVIQLSIDNRK